MSIYKNFQNIISLFKHREIVSIPYLVGDTCLLEGKTAIITGGSGGIGYAIAESLIQSGCNVIITGTNVSKLERCCAQLGVNAKYLQLELDRVTTFNVKIEEASHFYGPIDILINSAGIFSSNNTFINVEENEYDNIMDINLKGTYFITQAVANHMIKRNVKGHILMVSSQSALEPSWSPYRLSKFGLNGITRGIAQQLLPYGIVVNGIGPGPTATGMQNYHEGDSISTNGNPAKRYTMPQEIAIYAKYLVSDMGNMIIGNTIYLSGGRGIIEVY